MKIRPKCVPCLLNRTLYETDLVDPSKELQVIEEACRIIGKYDLVDSCSAIVASEVHKATYDILGARDPYKTIKSRCNQAAISLLPKAEKMIAEAHDKLKAAVLCSIIGNVLDFGIPSTPDSPEELVEHFDSLWTEGLGVDDTDGIRGYLEKEGKVLFFSDNCGEIVFDKLLLEQIKKYGVELTFVARGEPILTDATMDDVRAFGIDKVVDRVLTTGCFAVGVNFDKMGQELRESLDETDFIISKGMANYETFSETGYKPIAHLLRTKCEPVAESMGLKTDINVARLYE